MFLVVWSAIVLMQSFVPLLFPEIQNSSQELHTASSHGESTMVAPSPSLIAVFGTSELGTTPHHQFSQMWRYFDM